MLKVELNRANFEYDVNALVHSFYPGECMFLLTPESTERRRQQMAEEMAERRQAGERLIEMRMELFDVGARVRIGEQVFEWVFEEGSEEAARAEEPDETEEAAGAEEPDETEEAAGAGDPGETEEAVRAEEPGETEEAAGAGDPDEAKKEALRYKHGFKHFLYGALREYTGRSLPWGSLTGIRPTKIAYELLEQGYSDREILDVFTGTYKVSPEKAGLGLDIAVREREILRDVHYKDGYSLYIGIPFCPTTCLYCSFTSYPVAAYRHVVERYIDCLIRETEHAAELMSGRILDSVYIGGGTPTTLEPAQLDRLITALKRSFDFATVQEFTVEAGRADSITAQKLEVLRRHGVSRISVNPQTMKQETLDIIGRRATVEQVLAAYRLAREAGFDNINMDLILGLPGETETDVQNTIDRVVELAPDSLTVHSLAIKRASRLNQWIRENGIEMLRNTDETMAIAAAGAARLGMKPYYLYRQKNMSGNFENVGYARPGKYGLYNILIMEEKQTIVALGAGSITKRVWADGRIERCENVKEIGLYIEKIDEMIERKKRLLEE